jgi:hypothetical protein
MRLDEVKPFYESLKASADTGLGYGVDELPNFNYFVRNYVDNFHNIVFELTDTGELITYANYGPSPFSRSAAPVICDGGNMIIMSKFRRKRWFVELANLMYRITDVSDLPTSGYQGDTSVDNVAAFTGAMKMGYIVNGVLPKGIYFHDKGWVDMMLYFKAMPNGKAKSLL